MWRRIATGAAILLLVPLSTAAADSGSAYRQPARWLLDPQARCYLLYSDGHAADSVMWSGGCADRRAEGPGTATFLLRGRLVQVISGTFAEGMAIGQVQIVWAGGARFDGAMIAGRPDVKAASPATGGSAQRVAQEVTTNGAGLPVPVNASAAANPLNPSPLQIVPAAAPVGTAAAQSAPVAVSIPATWLDAFRGQKLFAVDGTAISFSTSGDSISVTTPPGSAVPSGYLIFLNGSQGLVSDDADAEQIKGLFRVSDGSLLIDYAAGGSAAMRRTPNGGLAIASSPGPFSACSIWYPEGHVFSAAEREAAVASYASRLGVIHASFGGAMNCGGNTPLQAEGTPVNNGSKHARLTRNRRASVAKTAMSKNTPEISATPVMVRASDVHLIDGAFSLPVPEAQPAFKLGGGDKIVAPASPSQCLSVEAEGADVGFRNHCGFEVQFAYCVVDAGDPVRLCGTGAPVGNVPPNGFGTLFAERNPKDMEHEFRWIACGGARGDVVPKLVRTEPPAGQCVRAHAS